VCVQEEIERESARARVREGARERASERARERESERARARERESEREEERERERERESERERKGARKIERASESERKGGRRGGGSARGRESHRKCACTLAREGLSDRVHSIPLFALCSILFPTTDTCAHPFVFIFFLLPCSCRK